MSMSHLATALLALAATGACAYSRRDSSQLEITNNILELTTVDVPSDHIAPSSKHLAQQRHALFLKRTRRQAISVQEDLRTEGGRIYMTNATIAGRKYALVIDTGSSDTWIISSDFQCLDPVSQNPIRNAYCGFGASFEDASSSTFQPIDHEFEATYTGGEFLWGTMGIEEFGIGRLSRGNAVAEIKMDQVIGVVDRGFWMGDGISSGLMGMAYPAIAEGINTRELNYTSVVWTIFQNPLVQPIFSLALNRPTPTNLRGGGLLAFGGLPNVTYEGDFVTVPVQPIVRNIYGYYAIKVDGFRIVPPASTTSTSTSTQRALLHRANNYFQARAHAKRQTLYAQTGGTMLIDSGTSLVYLPDAVVDYIATLFSPPAQYNSFTGLYIVNCNARAPRVAIAIAGVPFYMSEDDLMGRVPGAVGGPGTGAQRGQCVLSIQRAQGGSLVLGDAWMRNVLIAFDLAKALDLGIAGTDKNGDGGGNVRIAARVNY